MLTYQPGASSPGPASHDSGDANSQKLVTRLYGMKTFRPLGSWLQVAFRHLSQDGTTLLFRCPTVESS